MKKMLSLALIALLGAAFVGCTPAEPVVEDENQVVENEMPEETEGTEIPEVETEENDEETEETEVTEGTETEETDEEVQESVVDAE